MLAVKFHHLRALIHRPFLCLPWLQRNDLPFMDLLWKDRSHVERAERVCISEAQQTARLLHNVDDERSLIHDFPWWQMISCLICASSILLVAGAFFGENGNSSDLSSQDFIQDAETCLEGFQALLSVNSEAARKATDMLRGLTGLRDCSKISHVRQVPNPSGPSPTDAQTVKPSGPPPPPPPLSSLVDSTFGDTQDTDDLNW
ncbi:MAG: hypothetical protein MMC33_003802 [Icmadophila ericetorum]|nr:hypothetical protein [Icmadophila ericetorum]